MNYEPNTSLNLSLLSTSSRNNNNYINTDILFDPSSPNSSSISPPLSPIEPRVFSCNYCRRKFYSSQALGGHQNAHKLERTLAKKSRELSAAVRPHSGSNERAGSSYGSTGRVNGPIVGLGHDHQSHEGRFGRRDVSNYGYNWMNSSEYIINGGESVHHQEDLGQLDLSLRL